MPDNQNNETPTEEELISPLEVAGLEMPEAVDTNVAPGYEPPDDRNPYQRWQDDPSKENLLAVTRSLRPTIGSVLATMGGAGNPNIEARARVVAAKAVKSYNPEQGASLPTWVSQQLRQLTRDIRKSNSVLSVPDGMQLQAMNVYRASAELEDELGREPTAAEIADKTGIPVKRLEKIRRNMRAVAGEDGTEEGTTNVTATTKADFAPDAVDYIYADSDLIDRQILEHTLGYGGAKELDNKAIMAKLKLTPVQLSRRKARLGMRIKDVMRNLEAIQ